MKISVIITVYNLENYVRQAIESVLSQTRKADEIIVVDDGSMDGSVNIIESFGNKVQLIKMGKNSGVLMSFIAGLQQSTGDILSFLDGDDIWLPQKLEKVEAIFAARQEVMLVSHLYEWIDKNGARSHVIDETHKNLERVKSEAADLLMLDTLLKNSILCYKGVWLGSAFCIRRADLDLTAYIEWVTQLPGKELSHQDQPLAAYLIYANPHKKIHLVDEILFQYRVYATNSSGSSTNVTSAIKTLSRSIATVARTKDIVARNLSWKEENFYQTMKLRELEFYKALYTKNQWQALKGYVHLATFYWKNQKKIKEIQRLLVCIIFGPAKFLKWKTIRRFS